jgi:hypothetical protein
VKRVTIRIDEDDKPSVQWVFPNVNPLTMRFELAEQMSKPRDWRFKIDGIDAMTIAPGVLEGATLDMHLDARPADGEFFNWQVVK